MGLCIAVTSGKGGTGKSTVSCGLALSFANMGKKVLAIDMDLGLRCLDMFFGIEEDVVFDLNDALESKEYETAVYRSKNFDNIYIVPAPAGCEPIDSNLFAQFVEYCSKKYDVVIFDLPAGISFSPFENVKTEIKYLCVTNLDGISVRDASVIGDHLEEKGIRPLLIINRFEKEFIEAKVYKNFDDIVDTSGIMLLGVVPNSIELGLFPIFHKIKRKGRGMKAFNRIAKRLCGESVLLPNPKKI